MDVREQGAVAGGHGFLGRLLVERAKEVHQQAPVRLALFGACFWGAGEERSSKEIEYKKHGYLPTCQDD